VKGEKGAKRRRSLCSSYLVPAAPPAAGPAAPSAGGGAGPPAAGRHGEIKQRGERKGGGSHARGRIQRKKKREGERRGVERRRRKFRARG